MVNAVSDVELNEVIQNTRHLLPEFKNKRILLTGGTGFFGKWISQVLVKANNDLKLELELVIVTRNKEQTLLQQAWLKNSSVVLLEGDIRNFQLDDKPYDFVIHGATAASASLNDSLPAVMADTIVEGTKQVLAQLEKLSKPRFLFISSGAVYGAQNPDILHMPELNNVGPDITSVSSAYAEGKRMAEFYCQCAKHKGSLSLTIARCYAFVGPYLPLDTHFAAGNFINDFLHGRTIKVNGDGTPYRSYMYPTDLVEWLLTVLIKGSNGYAYNVGSDEEIQLKDLPSVIGGSGYKTEIVGTPTVGAKRNSYVPSVEKAKNELGLTIRVNLPEAFRRTINWYKTTK